jgi:outer membrane protein
MLNAPIRGSMTQSRLVHTIAVAAMTALAHAGGAAAQQGTPASGKIGYVNTERVMREARASQQMAQALQAEFKKRGDEITGTGPDVERRRAALLEDFNARREESIKQFIARANAVIRRIGQQENFDAVFIEANYADKHIDITDRVIKALDAER